MTTGPATIIITGPQGQGTSPQPFNIMTPFAFFDFSSAIGVVLTSDKLTAFNDTGGANGGVCAVAPQGGGKFYYEIELNGDFSGNLPMGIGITSFVPNYADLNNTATEGVMNFVSGVVWAIGTHNDPITGHGYVGYPLSVGNTYGVAVDISAGFVWFALVGGPGVGGSLQWNAGGFNNIPHANPVTGVDGFPLPLGDVVPFVSFGGDSDILDAYTANFGQNPFQISQNFIDGVPNGYELWPV